MHPMQANPAVVPTGKTKYRYHPDRTKPASGSAVWVFGSNLAGRHGKGAALEALQSFGAACGVGIGPCGNSYAIPTKDMNLEVISLLDIRESVKTFIDHARSLPGTSFFVTRIGCGYAGYSDYQIAPMFRDAPTNCSFAEQWKSFLE